MTTHYDTRHVRHGMTPAAHRYACLAAAALTLGACGDTPAGPRVPAPNAQIAAAPPPPVATMDDSLAALSDAIPGFGGMFIDETGTMNVYLTDTTQQARALPAVAAVMSRGREQNAAILRAVAAPRARRGAYTFRQLYNWRRALATSGALANITRVDIDDTKNRIAIGVLDQATLATVRARLQKLGVPDAAALVEVREPAVIHTTLQDMIRPIPAGVQISSVAGICTLGFNARLGYPVGHIVDSSATYFVTNSHCTIAFGSEDVADYGQPLATNVVGHEVFDKPLYTSATLYFCPATRKCRYSDASLLRYNSGVPAAFAKIALPTFFPYSVTLGTVVTMNGFYTFSWVGDPVVKIGRTSGLAGNDISATCVDETQYENVNGVIHDTGRTMLCQTEVPTWSYGGDSGGPVITNDANRRLVGITWGGNANLTIFSPIGQVLDEINSWPGKSPSNYQFTPYYW